MTPAPESPLHAPHRSLPERLFGDWVRELSPATLRADALADLLGLDKASAQGAVAVAAQIGAQLGLLQPAALVVAAATVGVALAVRRGWRSWPHMLIGMLVGTALA